MTRRTRGRRSGAILIVALVALAIFASLSTTSIRSLLSHRQAVKTERDLIQAELLCDAGCDRAASRHAEDPAYAGELWLDQKDPDTGVVMQVAIEILHKEGKTTASIRTSVGGRNQLPAKIQRTRTIVLSE